ncbi:lactate utilization protein [Chitinophaga silvatica]|uniref:Lactate utilization protein n=2 Tax=Chitinophaga silvatica TaxID=2282649 RepID=A0A3E1Y8F2_9BACT|nr:lactate utilization protein [Chitinophaga silvatica]
MANEGDQLHSAAENFKSFEYIIGPAGSCVKYIKMLLDAIPQTNEVAQVQPRTNELIEFLHDILKVESFPWKNIGTDPNNYDPHYLNEAMRENARKKFLSADAGMTGVNFALAETGTFVVCPNEGNAGIGASVPPLHIVSMGIEKLIPEVTDLSIFISLLSRSALGTLATRYTSHFTGPRPGSEMHIIITDNGRSRRLRLNDFWHSLKGIRCGACMNTYPVYRRSGGLAYGATNSGPIGVIPDPTFDESKYSELPYHSTCGSCTDVCPVKIDISDQILKWRKVMAEKKYLPISRRLAFGTIGKVFEHPGLFRSAETATGSALRFTPHFLLYNRALNPGGRHRELPSFAKQTFRERYLQYKAKDHGQ